MRASVSLAVVVVGILTTPVGRAAEPVRVSLETLFYSPAERRAIVAERQRQTGDQFNFRTSLSVKGLVSRASGKGSIWINDQTIPEGQTALSGGVPRIDGKAVSVEGHAVKVGETVDMESGQRVDVVPEGTLRVRR